VTEGVPCFFPKCVEVEEKMRDSARPVQKVCVSALKTKAENLRFLEASECVRKRIAKDFVSHWKH